MMFDGGLFVILNILGVVFLFKGNITFRIVALIIFFALGTILLAGYGVYKGFFANKDLLDPWEDHDD